MFFSMAVSLDGYIASKDGDMAWLNNSMSRNEDCGFSETMKRTGAYIMRANTYRESVSSGMGGGDTTKSYVVTHDAQSDKTSKSVEFYSGDLSELVKKAKGETDKDICLFEGADIINQFIDEDLVDELGIAVVPVLLGDGVPLHRKLKAFKKLKPVECKKFDSGIVIVKYEFGGKKKK